jgi:hypothetical protein
MRSQGVATLAGCQDTIWPWLGNGSGHDYNRELRRRGVSQAYLYSAVRLGDRHDADPRRSPGCIQSGIRVGPIRVLNCASSDPNCQNPGPNQAY